MRPLNMVHLWTRYDKTTVVLQNATAPVVNKQQESVKIRFTLQALNLTNQKVRFNATDALAKLDKFSPYKFERLMLVSYHEQIHQIVFI